VGDLVRDNDALEHLLRLPGAPRIGICGAGPRARATLTADLDV
jgi:Rrf2 family nitric oxide-sensitive transcriptional repressor